MGLLRFITTNEAPMSCSWRLILFLWTRSTMSSCSVLMVVNRIPERIFNHDHGYAIPVSVARCRIQASRKFIHTTRVIRLSSLVSLQPFTESYNQFPHANMKRQRSQPHAQYTPIVRWAALATTTHPPWPKGPRDNVQFAQS